MVQKILLTALFLLVLVANNTISAFNAPCQCGTLAAGIYTYDVDGDDCCKDTPYSGGATYQEYVQQTNGVYILANSTTVTGSVAQKACCTPNS